MVYTIEKDTPITLDVVNEYLLDHYSGTRRATQLKLKKAYLGEYDILEQTKPSYKPNNKLVNNFAKYIVDTFCGFFDGKPLTVSSQNEAVQKAVDNFDKVSTSEFKNYELIKRSAIFGNCYELVYQNEEGDTKNAVLDPLDTFAVYDDTVEQHPVFAVTYRLDDESKLTGEVYTADTVYSITGDTSSVTTMTEVARNEYYDVPIIEYRFNTERQGIFENVLSLINAYNLALSEKANDVEYFADAYLVILGADIAGEGTDQQEAFESMVKNIRDNRTMLFQSDSAVGSSIPEVKFLGKPEADTTQENLLKALKENIFRLSMVADISDEAFGTSSGIALQYKLQPMRDLAKSVQQNITMSLKHRYKLVFSFAKNISPTLADEWQTLEFNFYENLPINALDIANTLASLGVRVSEETALKLAGIDNPMQELERIKKEEELAGDKLDSQISFLNGSDVNE